MVSATPSETVCTFSSRSLRALPKELFSSAAPYASADTVSIAVRSSVTDVRAAAACVLSLLLTWSSALASAETSIVRSEPIASRLLRTSLAAVHTDSAHWAPMAEGVAVGGRDDVAVGDGVLVADSLAPPQAVAIAKIIRARAVVKWRCGARRRPLFSTPCVSMKTSGNRATVLNSSREGVPFSAPLSPALP